VGLFICINKKVGVALGPCTQSRNRRPRCRDLGLSSFKKVIVSSLSFKGFILKALTLKGG